MDKPMKLVVKMFSLLSYVAMPIVLTLAICLFFLFAPFRIALQLIQQLKVDDILPNEMFDKDRQ